MPAAKPRNVAAGTALKAQHLKASVESFEGRQDAG
jgi:hypothetical protein